VGFPQLRGRPPDAPLSSGIGVLSVPDAAGIATFVGAALFVAVLSVPDPAGVATWVGTSTSTITPIPVPALQRPYVFGPGGGLQYQSRPSDVILAPAVSSTLSVPDPAGTATFVGASQFNGVLASSGSGVATWVGASLFNSVLSVPDPAGTATFLSSVLGAPVAVSPPQWSPAPFNPGGFRLRARPPMAIGMALSGALSVPDPAGVATWVGASQFNGVLSASGTGAATWTGAAVTNTTWGADVGGVGTASWVGAAATAGVLTVSDPAGTATWVGAPLGTPIFFPPAPERPYPFGPGGGIRNRTRPADVLPAGSASLSVPDAVGTATFTGASLFAGVLASSGAGTATWVGAAQTNGVLSESDAAGVATWVGAATTAGVLSVADASSTDSFFSPAQNAWPPPLQVPGIFKPGSRLQYRSRPSDVSTAAPPVTAALSVPDSAGVATWVGASLASDPLTATGTGTAAFVGAAAANGVLTVNDPAGTATWVSATSTAGVLSATGTAVAAFTSSAIAASPFSAVGSGTATWYSPGGGPSLGGGDVVTPTTDMPELSTTGMMGGSDSGGLT
jgi:hypothetical protein